MDSVLECFACPALGIPLDRTIRFATPSTATQPRVLALAEVPGGLDTAPWHFRRQCLQTQACFEALGQE